MDHQQTNQDTPNKMLPQVTRPATSLAIDDNSPISSKRRYMTPDPSSTTSTTTILLNTPSAVPSLDLSILNPTTTTRRPETTEQRNTTTTKNWENDNIGKAAKSIVTAGAAAASSKRKSIRKPVPPGGSARERGKYGGNGGGKGGTAAPNRYQKWMSKSVLEIRRANERATNPYSPLYKRARASKKKPENKKVKIHSGNMDMNNITNRLHDHLSLEGLGKEQNGMLCTKEKNVAMLRMRYDRLASNATKKENLYNWNTKEISRIKRELGELKSLSEAADNAPEVVFIKNKLKKTSVAADREESYTYVMRLLTNRARYPLKASTKRLEKLKKELSSASRELKNLQARQHRLDGNCDKVFMEKKNLEQQSKDLYNIYAMKVKALENVEKQRRKQSDNANKQEEERINLYHVLHGDRGVEAENQLKTNLMRGMMKGKAVTARANILQKTNDELNKAFKKMMEVAADNNIDSVSQKYIEKGIKTQELESNLEHLTSRLMTAKNRNDNLNAELLGLQLKYSDPLSERRLQHQCDEMETKLHKLNLLKDVDGEKGE